ncbi:MAG: TfoX C-terminal domain [Rhodobacteraceae bacterium HLUCCO18]|nr:MAG: TfoX C-terminal domain [Rhodobacteraceae bacterium HLUCCO18]
MGRLHMTAARPADGTDPVTAIRNIGPAQAAALAHAGIHTASHLREIGADAAYAAILRSGTRPHFIAYYTLVMGLQGRPWNDCAGEEKLRLRKSFDALVAQTNGTRAGPPRGIDAILDRIGTGPRR